MNQADVQIITLRARSGHPPPRERTAASIISIALAGAVAIGFLASLPGLLKC